MKSWNQAKGIVWWAGTVLGTLMATCIGAQTPVTGTQPAAQPAVRLRSRISVYDLRDHTVHVLYTADELIEAPNWSPDGTYLLANSKGSLYRYNLQPNGTASPETIDLGGAYTCNNDKAISADGRRLAFSATRPGSTGSQIFIAEANGSNARLVIPEAPSYFHGWSPDGRWLAFVAKREVNFDLYRVAAAGGAQERLTRDAGHNDGPDYSPDGQWIYFNSDRSGSEQIWRLPADADDKRAERITSDDMQDWFPHPSRDGKWIAFLAFPKEIVGHNARVQVQLRVLPVKDGMTMRKDSELLQTFFGGQGTINVNSWSPDSTRIAYVSYEPLP